MAATAMSQRVLEGVHRLGDQARSFLRSDSSQSPDAGSLRDALEGVQACLRLRGYLQDSAKSIFDEAFSGQTDDYNATGQLCRVTFQVALRTFEAVRKEVQAAAAQTAPEDLRQRFQQAIQEFNKAETTIKQLQDQFEKNWPWVDANLLTYSTAGQGAERRRPAKEAFDEIRSRHRREGI